MCCTRRYGNSNGGGGGGFTWSFAGFEAQYLGPVKEVLAPAARVTVSSQVGAGCSPTAGWRATGGWRYPGTRGAETCRRMWISGLRRLELLTLVVPTKGRLHLAQACAAVLQSRQAPRAD